MNLTLAADVVCKGEHVESMFANDVQVWPPDYAYYQVDFEFDPVATYNVSLDGFGVNQTTVGYVHTSDVVEAYYKDVNDEWNELTSQDIYDSISDSTNDYDVACNWLYYTLKGSGWFTNYECFTFKTGASMSNMPIRVTFWGFLDNNMDTAVKLASKVITCSPNTLYTIYRGDFD